MIAVFAAPALLWSPSSITDFSIKTKLLKAFKKSEKGTNKKTHLYSGSNKFFETVPHKCQFSVRWRIKTNNFGPFGWFPNRNSARWGLPLLSCEAGWICPSLFFWFKVWATKTVTPNWNGNFVLPGTYYTINPTHIYTRKHNTSPWRSNFR